jgi:DNA transposition AAA+ family ATPase
LTDLTQNLENDSRLVLVHAPAAGDAAELAAFVVSVREYMTERGISQTQLADRIDVSKSAVCNFLNGNYTGDVAGLAQKVAFFVNAEYRRSRRDIGPGFVETTVALKIKSLIARVESFGDEEGRIGVIIGDAGGGKSACLRAYADADKAAVLVSHDSAQRVHGLLDAIARASGGFVGCNASLSLARARLVELLERQRRVILVDEASSLRAKDLDKLRTVICIRCKCPLILAGNNDLLRTIRENSDKGGYASLDQFNSRLIGVLNLDELAASGDDGPLYSAADLRKLFEFGGVRLTGDAVDALGRICRTPKSGKLRTCRDIIRALHSATRVIESGRIDAASIWAAVEQLRLPVADWLPVVCRKGRALSRAATA